MVNVKQSYEVELGIDQIAFIRTMKDKYEIIDEGKTLRALIDYLIVNRSVHDEVFGKRRCFRCD